MPRGAKTSPEMLKARALIERGATAYAAAKQTGLTTGAITRSKWYRDRVAAAGEDAGDDVQERARKLVVDEGLTAYAAAARLGIAQSTISRAAWYRDHIDALVRKFQPGGEFAAKRGAK